MPIDAPTLFRTPSGTLLHLPACPHLLDTDPGVLVEVSVAEFETYTVCKTCEPELEGRGATRFDSFEDALEALPVPLENRPRCREIASTLTYDRIWIPASRPYVAVGNGGGVVAYFAVGYVYVQAPGEEHWREEFPNFGGSTGGSRERRADQQVTVCPVHQIALPASGVCDDCA